MLIFNEKAPKQYLLPCQGQTNLLIVRVEHTVETGQKRNAQNPDVGSARASLIKYKQ